MKKFNFSASSFCIVFSLLNTIIFNYALLHFLAYKLDLISISGALITLSIFTIIFLVNIAFTSFIVIFLPLIIKPLYIITSLINSFATYYMVSYNITLNKSMISNIINTRFSEASELITSDLYIYIFVFFIIPSFLIINIKIHNIKKYKILFNAVAVFFIGVLYLYINSFSWLWIDKHASLIGGKILPWSYIINSYRHYSESTTNQEQEILLPDGYFLNDKKMVVVLIIGETARSHNFSLYGYPRTTNPLLQTDKILTFKETKACATYTTASLACILSHDTSQIGYEPLPTYLTRIGVDVIWRTNNWGEPKITVSKFQKRSDLKEKCLEYKCDFDEILLTELHKEIILSKKTKTLIVLHTKGSHGPSYYSRYPESFEKFLPVCRYENIKKCTQQELVNAYDNTIVYTDYFLHKTIRELKSLNDTPSMLIYISDHGESLGEYGFYLHGAPYFVAPKYQKEIPFIIWRSEEDTMDKVKTTGSFSHSNIFHTIIGALDIETKAYNKKLDVLKNTE